MKIEWLIHIQEQAREGEFVKGGRELVVRERREREKDITP
jgi:hypothetical protein